MENCPAFSMVSTKVSTRPSNEAQMDSRGMEKGAFLGDPSQYSVDKGIESCKVSLGAIPDQEEYAFDFEFSKSVRKIGSENANPPSLQVYTVRPIYLENLLPLQNTILSGSHGFDTS